MDTIYHVTDKRFTRYGKIINELPITQLMKEVGKIENNFEGVRYERSLEVLERTEDFRKVQKWYGGEQKLQCGLCWGHNRKMNAVEYHRSSEINIGGKDMVLMLGDLRDVEDNSYKSELLEFFYVPKGIVIELFGTTLHFAPCQLNESGFSTIVILPEGTNASLEKETQELIPAKKGEERLLFGKNKWMIAHPECEDAKSGFAFPGIVGANREVGENIQLQNQNSI